MRGPEGYLRIRVGDYRVIYAGRAPWKDNGGQFKGGRQLQIPFNVLAAAKLLPELGHTRRPWRQGSLSHHRFLLS